MIQTMTQNISLHFLNQNIFHQKVQLIPSRLKSKTPKTWHCRFCYRWTQTSAAHVVPSAGPQTSTRGLSLGMPPAVLTPPLFWAGNSDEDRIGTRLVWQRCNGKQIKICSKLHLSFLHLIFPLTKWDDQMIRIANTKSGDQDFNSQSLLHTTTSNRHIASWDRRCVDPLNPHGVSCYFFLEEGNGTVETWSMKHTYSNYRDRKNLKQLLFLKLLRGRFFVWKQQQPQKTIILHANRPSTSPSQGVQPLLSAGPLGSWLSNWRLLVEMAEVFSRDG